MTESSIEQINNTNLIQMTFNSLSINKDVLKIYNDRACRPFPTCKIRIDEIYFLANPENYLTNTVRYLANLNSVIRRMDFMISNVRSKYLDNIQDILLILKNLQYQLQGYPETFIKSTLGGIIGPRFR